MRDGVILGVGKGNPDWNYSAPHGSGRVLRRDEVKNHYTVSAFKNDMKGIYSSSISAGTLDEAPVAYRGIDEILDVISDSVEVTEVIKPVYNFKAGKER
jgi:RNA-splicing ligase RtcB